MELILLVGSDWRDECKRCLDFVNFSIYFLCFYFRQLNVAFSWVFCRLNIFRTFFLKLVRWFGGGDFSCKHRVTTVKSRDDGMFAIWWFGDDVDFGVGHLFFSFIIYVNIKLIYLIWSSFSFRFCMSFVSIDVSYKFA